MCIPKVPGAKEQCINEKDPSGNEISACYCFDAKCNSASPLAVQLVLSLVALILNTIL